MSASLRADDSGTEHRPPAPARLYDPRPEGVWTPIKKIKSGIFAGRFMSDIEVGNLVCAAELCDPRGDPPRVAPRTIAKAARDPSSSPTTRAAEPTVMSPTSSSNIEGDEERIGARAGSQRAASPANLPRASTSRHPETPGQGTSARNRDNAPKTPPQAQTSRSSSKGSDRSRSARGGSRGRSRGDDKRVIVGRNLYGSLHVAGIRVAAMDGEAGLWFLFTFRCYDMSAIDPELGPIPHLVDTQSDDFRVYSPRNFPGLPKPTELAEHFALQGYKLNTRKVRRCDIQNAMADIQNERQQASPNPSPPP
ncbi:hypothetical protein A1Q2_03809 [Trichosporon asahii var. asahii CBS 8904]|uniref:Velvet domain-containing protein n=1 Tax=Trichosporon asahii var. asahii (strain CBS 8904) TaxID=1220162 RepID=K1VQZ8_TRIAC|nr:hypothetical protein A1Q2_03809 [Trichosporon asahii var. asahii CBS 8904]